MFCKREREEQEDIFMMFEISFFNTTKYATYHFFLTYVVLCLKQAFFTFFNINVGKIPFPPPLLRTHTFSMMRIMFVTNV